MYKDENNICIWNVPLPASSYKVWVAFPHVCFQVKIATQYIYMYLECLLHLHFLHLK